ncbi:glycosyltransferase [Sutcliffiella horikoshii]|uniref:glycosyltransferase family 2 protein n=1 Tax=Sutcliffiella horikoshii TaxID=79883 RepID=UPI00384FC041
MYQPQVTVFIPVYNSEKNIKECINSIIDQTYKNLEILIVDDGSTDNSLDIINSFNDNRIRLIRNNENKGIPYTRNLGLQEAKGKYLAVMDSDDIAFLNRIEVQVKFMEKNKDIDVLGSNYQLIGGKFNKKVISKFTIDQEIKAGLIFLNRICNSTAFIRLESINNFKIKYNPSYFVVQDYDFFVQVSKIGKLFILPEILIKYRISHSNITAKSKKNKSAARQEIINAIQLDILKHYNFHLSEKELSIFNDFFSKNVSYDTLKSIPNVVNKLIDQNNNNEFNRDIFSRVVKESTFDVLNSIKFNLKDKLKVYSKFCGKDKILSNFVDISYLVANHIYKKIS